MKRRITILLLTLLALTVAGVTLTFTVFTASDSDLCSGTPSASKVMDDFSHNPGAATSFFDPGPTGASSVTQDLLTNAPVSGDVQRSYPALRSSPSCASLGDALVVATGSSSDGVVHSPANTRIMFAVIAVLGGALNGHISATMAPQLTSMLASYLKSGDINAAFVRDGLTLHVTPSNGSPSANPPQASLDVGRLLANLATDPQRYMTLQAAENEYITGCLKMITTAADLSNAQDPNTAAAASRGFGEIRGLLALTRRQAIAQQSSGMQAAEFWQNAYQDAERVVLQALKANPVLGSDSDAVGNADSAFSDGEGDAGIRASAYGVRV